MVHRSISPLQKVQESALKILTPLDSEKLYRTCVKEAVSLAQAHSGSLFLSKNDLLVRVYSTVPRASRLNPRPNGDTYQAFHQGKTRLITKQKIEKNHPEAVQSPESILVIPLSYQEKRVGVITLHFRKVVRLNPEIKGSLKLFGSLATLAIRNLELYERSRTALETRELFMSTAAHEFKTPLAVIQAYAQIAEKKLSQGKPIESKWIESILVNGSRLQSLVQELFSVSQMRMGIFTYHFSAIQLVELISKNVSDLSLLHKRKITFKTKLSDQESLAQVDPEKITQVISNVIGNAVKFSEPHTSVQVKLKRTAECYQLTIEDQGHGISPSDVTHVFEQFFQGGDKRAVGMGLGMYLCKQILEAHQGEIKLTSRVNVGTKVTISLPLPTYARI